MSEHAGEDAVDPAVLDGSAAEWANERAAALDLEVDEFLERLLLAYRAAESGDLPDSTDEDELEALETKLAEVETEMDTLIEDVRERVVQVKKEADAKAPQDHDHQGLEVEIEETRTAVEDLEASVEGVRTDLDQGFDNFQEILEYLLSRTDEMAENVGTVGSAVVELREKLDTIAAREHWRRTADRLKTIAAKRGVRTARCETCDSKIDVALLAGASCPACDATFRDLDANPGFFGTSYLLTGSRPALEGPSDTPTADEVEAVVSAEAERVEQSRHEDWFAGVESTGDTSESDTDADE